MLKVSLYLASASDNLLGVVLIVVDVTNGVDVVSVDNAVVVVPAETHRQS